MDNFKIIEDNIISYGESDQLFVMLIKINESFCFQIDSKHKGICRRTMLNRKTAESAVESITQSLSTYKDIASAESIVYHSLKMKTLREFLFLLKINIEIEYGEIFNLRKRFGYLTHPIDGSYDDYGLMEIHDEIAITFPNNDNPIGYYRPICEDSNTYKFHLSEFYSFTD